MMSRYIGVIFLYLIVLTGCSIKPAVIDYQPGISFSEFQLYALGPAHTKVEKSLNDVRIEKALEWTMSQKNYQKMTHKKADMWLIWKEKPEIETRHRTGFGFGFGYGMEYGRTGLGVSMVSHPPVQKIVREVLVLEIVDSKTSKVMWSAESKKLLLKDGTPTARERQIRQIVRDMLYYFPPQ
ncbi:hypothetical protein A9Q81_00210 [Gammaproteobacteria bacterium 42_54_T18]|nr:hypothetical protein A9Q81_00210 [Gammaproteobacteria bacterium 42_54_T18]